MKEAKAVADSNYWKDNCWWFAKELTRRLHQDGYEDVKYCIGIAKWCVRGGNREDDCWHGWTKLGSIAIESTEGKIIEPRDYEKDYDERKCYSATSEVVLKSNAMW
jgi:hypothetical protein